MTIKKLSERLQEAYMVGDQAAIEELKKEAEELRSKNVINNKVKPLKVNNVLNNDKTSAIDVYKFLNNIFGEDWYDWEFETLERMLWVNYATVLEDVNRDKIWAVKHLLNSQRPFLDWFQFNQIALAFGGVIADFEQLRKPTPGMVINCVLAMKEMRPDEPFSREVKKYICIILADSGIYTPPPSIIDVIKEEFEFMVSNDMRKEWSSVFRKYIEMTSTSDYQIKEDVIDIQAKRLLNAETAALEY